MSKNYFGSTFGKTSKNFGGGKNVWHEVKACYPIGGVVDPSDYTDGTIIPAGSPALLNQSTHEVTVVPAYSATKDAYAVGDYVIQAGSLYVCKTAIAAAEAFTAAKWTVQTAATLATAGLSLGLLYHDLLIDEAAKDATYGAATAAVVYAGEVYASRLDIELGSAFLALVPQIVPIYEA